MLIICRLNVSLNVNELWIYYKYEYIIVWFKNFHGSSTLWLLFWHTDYNNGSHVPNSKKSLVSKQIEMS